MDAPNPTSAIESPTAVAGCPRGTLATAPHAQARARLQSHQPYKHATRVVLMSGLLTLLVRISTPLPGRANCCTSKQLAQSKCLLMSFRLEESTAGGCAEISRRKTTKTK
eukprot:6178856-Pleurochrysis_carterae.AAC.3